ncbi:class I SAM-dependent methyltransferase [Falsiroseomonas oryzae]|uniref:class I SAM-dependent methyltransferase n=1 Tax=Falsiroseomonas oryzae TaxID=2766473 RepID=UPI0022EA98A7|nr:class I SAM-dependent methyltransferase [Roseomonas sp. MO-31]
MALLEAIAAYDAGRPAGHHAGSLAVSTVRRMAEICGDGHSLTMETGCGKSTILFSNLSQRHLVFTFDDRAVPDSSVAYYQGCPVTRLNRVEPHFGPTQMTVPRHHFDRPIDVALLDGPHAWPFVELEYYFVYPHIRRDGWLILDDIHIPTIGQMLRTLAADPMWSLEEIAGGTTALLRRTAAPALDPLNDGWWLQGRNAAEFPSFPMDLPDLTPGETVAFRSNEPGIRHLMFGWRPAESWGCWAAAHEATIGFAWRGESGAATLRMLAKLPAPVEMALNGAVFGSLAMTPDASLQDIAALIPAGLLRPGGPNLLRFRFPEPVWTESLPRWILGIAVGELTIEA